MKYIRTKDGKIHISYSDYQGFEKLWVCKKRNTLADFYYVRRSNIVKQADNLKDLCDDYFAISNTNYKTPIKIDFDKKIIYQWQSNQLVVSYTFEQFIPYHTIYGAIWTDRGLIYVAKMNDKGELELL